MKTNIRFFFFVLVLFDYEMNYFQNYNNLLEVKIFKMEKYSEFPTSLYFWLVNRVIHRNVQNERIKLVNWERVVI